MNKTKMIKKAVNYVKFQQKMLKEIYDGEFKSPFQIKPEKEKKKFFKLVKKEWAKFKKESHVRQLDRLDKDSLQDYMSHYLPDFDIKDIDIAYHVDRLDLDMWAHGKGDEKMYGIQASYPLFDEGEVMVEVYAKDDSGKKNKVDSRKFDKYEKAISYIKKMEKGEKVEEEEKEDSED